MPGRYRSVLVVMAAAVAGVSVTGAAQQSGARGQAPRTAQTLDGLLYVLTEENDAALLRLEPGPAPAK